MSGEIIAILSVGIGLGLLSTGLFAWLRTDLVKVEERLRTDLVTVEERLRADFKQLADRVGRLEYGQAKLEGLLEGLRELSPVGPPANKSILSLLQIRSRA